VSRWSARRLQLFVRPEGMVLAGARDGAPSPELLPSPVKPEGFQQAADCLTKPQWHSSAMDIILSNRCVRYCLTEPPLRLLRSVEETILVSATFKKIHGDLAEKLRIRVQSQPPDAGAIGAGVDESLAQSLERLMDSAGISRYTIRTLMDAAIEDQPAIEGWWVLVEPRWLCIFMANDAVWRHVSAHPCDDDYASRIPRLLTRLEHLTPTNGTRKVRVQTLGYPVPKDIQLPKGWELDRTGKISRLASAVVLQLH